MDLKFYQEMCLDDAIRIQKLNKDMVAHMKKLNFNYMYGVGFYMKRYNFFLEVENCTA